MLRPLSRIACFALLVAALPAISVAGVLIVDTTGAPGTFTTIQSACTAAAEGDTILIKSGAYASFGVVDKALTIAADAGAVVDVLGAARVRNLSAGKTVTLIGLRATGQRDAIANDVHGLALTANQGRVRAVGCTFRGVDGVPTQGVRDGGDAVSIDASIDAALARCTATGGVGQTGYIGPGGNLPGTGGAALRAIASTVTLHDCALNGGEGVTSYSALQNPDGGNGTHAYSSMDSTLFASKTTFHAGDGGDGQSAMCYGSFGGSSGNCLHLESSGDLVRLVSPTEIAGVTGTSFGGFCGVEPGSPLPTRSGLPSQFIDLPVAGRSMNFAPNPTRESSTLAITLNGVPGDRAAIILSPTTASLFNAQWNGQQLFPLPAPARFLILGVVPPSGTFTYNLGLSDLGPGVQAKTFFAQTLFDGTGGERVLGTAMPLLVLDSAF